MNSNPDPNLSNSSSATGAVSLSKVAVTGASGLIGRGVCRELEAKGATVIRLVRGTPKDPDHEVQWNTETGVADPSKLEGIDGLVHLAGETIVGRWNDEKKRKIRDSRVIGTRKLAENLAGLADKPQVLVSASAIGYYGDRGDEKLVETSAAGDSFLADVCKGWESATEPAETAGIRVVNLRIAMVLSRKEGALAKMLTPFKFGMGGKVGSGEQYWSWIAVDDVVSALIFALENPNLSGPVNGSSPQPVTNRGFTKTLGKVLNRPTLIPMPAFGARLAFGEMGDALMLCSARVLPQELENAGFEFQYGDLEHAVRHEVESQT